MKIFEYVKADSFFRDFLPEVKNYKHKLRGKNGRGNPVEFSDAEKNAIRAALKKMINDLVKEKYTDGSVKDLQNRIAVLRKQYSAAEPKERQAILPEIKKLEAEYKAIYEIIK